MKTMTARCIQVSTLDRDQVERLHEVEEKVGFALPNWNIQELFHLPSLKDIYHIPTDDELMSRHSQRIELELVRNSFFVAPVNYEKILDWVHSVDYKVIEDSGKIVWDYVGPRGKSRRNGRLSDQIKDDEEAVLA